MNDISGRITENKNGYVKIKDLINYAEISESTARKYVDFLKLPIKKIGVYKCINKKHLPLFQDLVKARSEDLKKYRRKEKKVCKNTESEKSRKKRFFCCFPHATEEDWKNYNTVAWFPDIDPFSSLKEDPELDKKDTTYGYWELSE